MKIKRLYSAALAVLLLFTLGTSALATYLKFGDITGHWCEETILSLADAGVIRGYPDGTVRPDSRISRGEFSALTTRAFDCSRAAEETVFEDVAGNWAEDDICALTAGGIIVPEEYGGHYNPDGDIARMEMIRMLVRAAGFADDLEMHSGTTDFTDDGLLSDSDRSFINLAQRYGILNGYPNGEVRAYATATRAEAFALLKRVLAIRDEIGQDEQDEEQPDPAPNPGSGSGYAPLYHAEVSIELPGYVYLNANLTIAATTRHTHSVAWTLWQDGAEVDLSSVLDGTLGQDGGTVRFRTAGTYTLKAAATGSSGRIAVCERIIRVYDTAAMTFTLPTTAHTDTSIPVEVLTEHLGEHDIRWIVQRDGRNVEYDGTLTNSGGVIRFVQAGRYTVIAEAEDAAGNPVSHTQTVEIFPVVTLTLTLPETVYTDETVTLGLDTAELGDLEVNWALTRNGEVVDAADWMDGSFGESRLRFKDKGVYSLTASVTDATGRTFSVTSGITVYPVGSAGFYLPELFHTDKTVTVEAIFNEIGSRSAIWSLTLDGKAVPLSDAVEGTLSNNGGTLRFYEKGSYVLKAKFTDEGGRAYRYEQSFTVYPVPTVSYSLPAFAHTDTETPVSVITEGVEGLSIEWLVDNTYGFQHWETYMDGTLTNSGGTIRFKHAGAYGLTARVTDATGRVFLYEMGGRCVVQPVLHLHFSMPERAHTGDVLSIRTWGNNNILPVEWTLTRDGTPVPLTDKLAGTLNAYGGNVSFTEKGSYTLTASVTDVLGRMFSAAQSVDVIPVAEVSFTMPEAVHYGTPFDVSALTANLEGRDLIWTLTQDGTIAHYTGTLDNDGGCITIHALGSFELTASYTDALGSLYTCTAAVDITNTAPTVTLTVETTRIYKDGKFLVHFNAVASDADGDPTELEWEGTTADSYYPFGTHTVRVRASDAVGDYSAWAEAIFTLSNSAPATPVIHRSPDGNSVSPGTAVTITASSTDPDGDAITYVWDGRPSETSSGYPLGKNTVKVKAVDAFGAESPWAAITFFVADSTNGGGMTLTGPESTIIEDGVEGATITDWTFTVPPVSGHSASYDYGQIRGYNQLTGQWEQLNHVSFDPSIGSSFAATDGNPGRVYSYNGVYMYGALEPGIYTMLEFYYYTPHNCMYNKSNITYSVNYHFE